MAGVSRAFDVDQSTIGQVSKTSALSQMNTSYVAGQSQAEADAARQYQEMLNNSRQRSILNQNKNRSGEHILFQKSTVSDDVYTSFSGADARVSISFKGGKPIAIGEAQTVTYSMFRPMTPVYNLGSPKPGGFVRGPRTIAGSIIFTVFDRHVLISALHNAYSQYDPNCLDGPILSDQLPPFDIQLTFMNEYGQSAFLAIHDVRITSEGQVMSIEDMITENTMQYVASDLTVMTPDIA